MPPPPRKRPRTGDAPKLGNLPPTRESGPPGRRHGKKGIPVKNKGKQLGQKGGAPMKGGHTIRKGKGRKV